MPKREDTDAVGQLIGELAAELGRLPAKEAREKLRSGAAIVASRKMALVSPEDLKLLDRIEDKSDLRAARKRLADREDDSIPWEDVKAELG